MGRMIHASMWEDEFFTSMPIFDRLLWIGLITVCADDQGRLQDNPAMIRSKVFPVDDIPISQISDSLDRISKDGKIVRYIAGKHKCIQIVNWWKHQKPQWASCSIYPPCNNWTDKIRYHKTKEDIEVLNWKEPGGFPDGYIDDFIDGKVTQEYESDIKKEHDIKDEGERETENAPSPFQRMIESVIGLPPGNATDMKALDEIEALNPTLPDIEAAYSWLSEQGKQVRYYSSLVGPIRTAIAKRVQKPMTPLEKSKAAIRQVIAEAELNPEEASRGIFD